MATKINPIFLQKLTVGNHYKFITKKGKSYKGIYMGITYTYELGFFYQLQIGKMDLFFSYSEVKEII